MQPPGSLTGGGSRHDRDGHLKAACVGGKASAVSSTARVGHIRAGFGIGGAQPADAIEPDAPNKATYD